MFYKVAVLGLSLPPLTYAGAEGIKLGSLVKVELRNKKRLGIIWQEDTSPPEKEIKEIEEIILPELLSSRQIRFYTFVSSYYFVQPGEVLSFALPFLGKLDSRLSLIKEGKPLLPKITRGVKGGSWEKAGVYLFLEKKEEDKIRFLLRKLAEREGSYLFLVPELIIGERLFTQLRSKINEAIIFYHSALKKIERIKIGWAIMEGKYRVVIGAKQSVFLPLPNLAGILVDEEESHFYKEEVRRFHYHARDCAVIRGKIESIPVYLFSSTPSLESFYNSQIGKYKLYGGFKRRAIRVIIADSKKSKGILSSPLRSFLHRYRKGECFYLFVQRKGFARYIMCEDCGFVSRCSECRFPLFYHRAKTILACHICQREEKVFDECPSCHGVNFLFEGIGLEKVERELKTACPTISPIRLEKNKGQERVGMVKRHGVFLGTSFALSKFLDGQLDLGVVISLEQILSLSDFRTEEEALRIIRKLAAKVKSGGFLIIQTKNPSHPLLGNIFNPPLFYRRLLKEREACRFPPFAHIALLKIYGGEEVAQRKYEELLKKFVQRPELQIFPPFSIRVKKRRSAPSIILIKVISGQRLDKILSQEDLIVDGGSVEIDVDPIEVLTGMIKSV